MVGRIETPLPEESTLQHQTKSSNEKVHFDETGGVVEEEALERMQSTKTLDVGNALRRLMREPNYS